MKAFYRLANRWLITDCRSPEFRLLAFSLWLSTSLVIGLSGFMAKVQLMLVGQSSEFLAADRVLSSPYPIDKAWQLKAKEFQLQQASTLSFQSMLYKGDEPILVSAKAVSEAYPLKGKLIIRDTLYGKTYAINRGPKAGELWADARLMMQFDIEIGDLVALGEAEFMLSHELVSEPDRGAGSFSLGPRVLMNWQDIEKTEVVQFGSRLSYRYLFSGDLKSLQDFSDFVLPQFSDSHKWLDLEQSQPSIAVALKRGQNFFLLASSIVIVLASIATAMASLRYASGHVKHIAVLKSLGARQGEINRLMLSIIAALFLVVYSLGALTGFLIQAMLIEAVSQSMQLPHPEQLWLDQLKPYFLGGLSCLLSLFAFLLPVLKRLSHIPAKHIFQQDALSTLPLYTESIVLWVVTCCVLVGVYTQNILLSIGLLVVLVVIVAIMALPVFALFKQLRRLPLRAASTMQLALSQLSRRLIANVVLCGIFSLCLTLLFILVAMQSSLFDQWRAQLPEKSPNFFVVNIQPQQLPIALNYIETQKLVSEPLFPIVRGRLTAVNDDLVRELVSKEDLKRAGVDRELSMSAAVNLPDDNSVLEGLWWDEIESDESFQRLAKVSVESKLAERLGIKVGDTLTFQIAADSLKAKVSSLRKVEWDRMKPNFYMLFDEQSLAPFSKTYMTSFYLPPERQQDVIQLLQLLPNAVLIDVDHLIQQIQNIVSQVSIGLRWVVSFVLLSSILVLLSLVQSSMPERLKENAILRSLGASKQRLLGALVIEFISLGLIAGILAIIVGQAVLLLLQRFWLDLPMTMQYSLWWFPPVLGATLVSLSGVLYSRRVVNQSPLLVLKGG